MAVLLVSVDTLIAQRQTNVIANPIKIKYMYTAGVHGSLLFVASNIDRPDYLHMSLGALQR